MIFNLIKFSQFSFLPFPPPAPKSESVFSIEYECMNRIFNYFIGIVRAERNVCQNFESSFPLFDI